MRKMKKYLLALTAGAAVLAAVIGMPQKASAREVEYNVKEYGVTGDGTTDDVKAINALLEKASALAAGDTLVLKFPEGKYMIGDWLRIRSNTTLLLDEKAEICRSEMLYPMMMNVGDDGTRKEDSAAGGGYGLTENIKIIGGILNGGDVENAAQAGNTVNFSHAQNVVFDGITLKNNYGAHLIELSGVKNATIKNCDFSGFRPEKGKEASLSEDKGLNTTGYTAKECIQLDYTYNHPTKKSLQWCPDYYSDKTPCRDIVIEENTFHDYPRGIGNHHGREAFDELFIENVTIRNNTFKNMYVTAPNGKKIYEYVILLHSFKNALVENNTITNAGSAVLLAYDRGSVVRKNKISNLTSTAIVAAKDTAGSKISQNTIQDVPRYGISVAGVANVASFSNNTLKTGSQKKKMINGITINGKDAYIKTIAGNKISDCSQFGISLLGVKKVDSITSNQFAKCQKAGICISDSVCKKVDNNKITGVKNSNSLMIAKKAKITSLSGNTITGSGKNAISIGSGAEVTAISQNTVSKSAGNGICLFEGAKAKTIENNKITDSQIGISILNSTCDKVVKNTVKKSKKFGICSTTATVKYTQKNTIDTAGTTGVLYCKKSKGTLISGNKYKNIKGKNVSVDATSKAKCSDK